MLAGVSIQVRLGGAHLGGGDLPEMISPLLSRDFWELSSAPFFSAPASSLAPLGLPSSCPIPNSTGLSPAELAMFGLAPTSSSWEMMLLLPILAAILSAVSPEWSWTLTTSLMKWPMPIFRAGGCECELFGPLAVPFGDLWLLGTLPLRTTHSRRLSK